MDDDAPVRLLRHGFLLEVAPGHGAGITRFAHDGFDLFRPAGDAWRNPRAGGCFPLVPFSNRIAHGRFTFAGRTVELGLNNPPEPHFIHGHGWEAAWEIEARDGALLALAFTHDRPGELLRYRARQRLELQEDGLLATLELVNQGDGPMPAGIGLHPYFPKPPGTTLETAATAVWLPDDLKIPEERVPVPPEWDFRRPRVLDDLALDHCFEGFSGRARIVWPGRDRALVIEAEPVFGHVVIFVPAGQGFFCVEPVSHVNDGFNQHAAGIAGTGVRILQPGETLTGRMRFRLEPRPARP